MIGERSWGDWPRDSDAWWPQSHAGSTAHPTDCSTASVWRSLPFTSFVDCTKNEGGRSFSCFRRLYEEKRTKTGGRSAAFSSSLFVDLQVLGQSWAPLDMFMLLVSGSQPIPVPGITVPMLTTDLRPDAVGIVAFSKIVYSQDVGNVSDCPWNLTIKITVTFVISRFDIIWYYKNIISLKYHIFW